MKKTLLFTFALCMLQTVLGQSYDDCSSASSSPAFSAGIYTVTNVDGVKPTNYCSLSGNTNVTNGEWIKYVPQQNYLVTLTTNLPQNAGKDTRVIVYTGDCSGLTCVTDHDDVDASIQNYLSIVTFFAEVGKTYFIAFDDKWQDSGFDFQITENEVSYLASAVLFTNQSVNLQGTYKYGFVDMNGDFLDDIVGITSTNISINYQQPGGGMSNLATNITTTSADFLPSWSLAAGDWDGNGYNDLLYAGGQGVTFMRANNNGTGYTEISYPQYVFSQRSNFVDMNNDGHLDAFVCHDVAPSVSYINDGNNNLIFGNTNGLGNWYSGGNYGSVWVDYDNDGDMDMFMAKCGPHDPGRDVDQLYRNNGDGTFTEVGAQSNLADDMQTWSAAWGDFDNDGYMDVYVGSSSGSDGNKLMRNNGDGTFTNVSEGSGIASANKGIENVPADFNNDGFIDILSNGSILYGNGDFTFIVGSGPSAGPIGDANNDGFLDVYNGTLRLNNGNDNNWIKIVTIGKSYETPGMSNRNGIGARVEISSALGTQIRDVRSGEGFRYMGTLNTHFGIRQDTEIDYIRIYWPSGIIDQINNPTINSTIIVTEGANTLSSDDTFVNDLIVYPNPTKSVLNLSTLNDLNDAIYSVFDINGRRVLNAKLESNTIDVTSLSAGQYILRIVSGSEVKNQKFIKQ